MALAQTQESQQPITRISQADVERLTADPSPENRAAMAAKLAGDFDGQKLSDVERRMAEEIFRTLVQDAEVRVREALSQHLKSSPDIPQDVALALANDVDSVALPILQYCEVLSDQDLIEIIGAGNVNKQAAVAQRSTVSGQVAGALIKTGNEGVVAKLVVNEGAVLDDAALKKVMTNYAKSETVSKQLAARPNLPAAVSEQLVSLITRQIQSYLVRRRAAPASLVKTLVEEAQEQATLSLLRDGCKTNEELEGLIDQLHAKGRLTPSLAVQALSDGDLTFFEIATARLANIPLENARKLIHDQSNLGIESLIKAIL